MKPTQPYLVLKQFSGSQDGHTPGEVFEEGEIVHLTEYLAACALKSGTVQGPVAADAKPRKKRR